VIDKTQKKKKEPTINKKLSKIASREMLKAPSLKI